MLKETNHSQQLHAQPPGSTQTDRTVGRQTYKNEEDVLFVAKLSPVLVRLAVGLEAGVGVALGLAQVLLLINLLCFLVVDCLIFHS